MIDQPPCGLRLAGLCRRFDVDGQQVDALRDLDLHVEAGQLLTVVGHSGCGKTTLLRLIAGLDQADSGQIETYSRPSVGGRQGQGVRPRIGMVFQDPRLLPWKTVRDNLLLALPRPRNGAEARRRADATLAMVGLGEFACAWPHQLSGGMAQRVALARALCRAPEILLLDEPFGALDALTRGRLHDEFAAIRRNRPLTTILVTHDIAEAVRLSDVVTVMNAGRITHSIAIDVPHPRPVSSPWLAQRVADITSLVLGGRAPAPLFGNEQNRFTSPPAETVRCCTS